MVLSIHYYTLHHRPTSATLRARFVDQSLKDHCMPYIVTTETILVLVHTGSNNSHFAEWVMFTYQEN